MKNENLFAESSMSLGEHLEELRKCLFAAIYWVALGSIGGVVFAQPAMNFIQIPVQNSLKKFYLQKATLHLEKEAKQLEAEGFSSEIVSIPAKHRMLPVELYLFPGEIERVLERQKGQKAPSDGVDTLAADTHFDEEPIRMMFFKKVEDDPAIQTTALGVHEAFGMFIKAALVIGLLIGSPGVLYQIWSFIAAGLYPHEKKYVYYFIPVCVALFLGGALFAFFFVFQFVLDFLFSFNAWMNINPDPRISTWMSFALLLPVGFGVSFQLPLVMFVLERVGIFTFKQYISSWRISVLAIFIIALLLTPGDPGSMLLMAIPLTILYFGGVFFCWFIPRKPGLLDFDPENQANF